MYSVWKIIKNDKIGQKVSDTYFQCYTRANTTKNYVGEYIQFHYFLNIWLNSQTY